MAALAMQEDNWTPADIKKRVAWRQKMFAPPKPVVTVVKKLERPPVPLPQIVLIGEVSGRFQVYGGELWMESRNITLRDIEKAVCATFGVRRLDLMSSRRDISIVRPRQIAMFLSKILTSRSFPAIGRHFGDKDHTTVIHAVKKCEPLYEHVKPSLVGPNSLMDIVRAADRAWEMVFGSSDYERWRVRQHKRRAALIKNGKGESLGAHPNNQA